jgi:hypothetical protein
MASVKIKSTKILYNPSCSALCTGVLVKNKEAGVSNVSYIIPLVFVFSSVMSIKYSLPPSDAPNLTKIWKAAGEDQLQQFALVLITVTVYNNNWKEGKSYNFSY